MVLFAIGLVAIVVIVVLFATGSRDLPVWLNVTAMLAPAGRERAAAYARSMAEPGRLTAALNYYRANTLRTGWTFDCVRVPTSYIYSTRDGAVGPRAVLGTRRWVDAPYRLVVLRGVSHWVPEEAPDAVADVALARIIDNV